MTQLDERVNEHYISSIDKLDLIVTHILLKTDGTSQRQLLVSAKRFYDERLEVPAWIDKFTREKSYYSGIIQYGRKPRRFFGKTVFTLAPDVTMSSREFVGHQAALLILLRYVTPNVPKLLYWSDDSLITTHLPGVSLKQAWYDGWLTREFIDTNFGTIFSLIGEVRKVLKEYGASWDASWNNILITKEGRVSLTDFEPVTKHHEIFNLAAALVNLAQGKMIFNNEGELVKNEQN